MKLSLVNTKHFERDGFSGDIYVDKHDGKGFNALQVQCITRHYKTRLIGAARAYLVLAGSGSFTINGTQDSAEVGDFFLISDGEVYEYEGKMKLFEFNVPGTDGGNEEKLD